MSLATGDTAEAWNILT